MQSETLTPPDKETLKKPLERTKKRTISYDPKAVLPSSIDKKNST